MAGTVNRGSDVIGAGKSLNSYLLILVVSGKTE